MQPSPGKPAPKPNVPPRPDNVAKPASPAPKQSKPPASPASRVPDTTQVFEDTGAAARPATNRPAGKDTDASGLAGTEVFNEPPAASPPKAAARSAAAAPARPTRKSQVADALDATAMFTDTSAKDRGAPAGKAPVPKMPNTSALEATGEFTDSDDASPPKRPATAAPKPKPKAAASDEQLGVFCDFQLTKKLGEGGMGSVYKAQQISMDRPVALKIMAEKIADNETFVQRFYREARTMARLDHPNIVRGYAVGQDSETGQHFVAMEFVDGGSMQKWMTKLGKLSVGDAVHIALCSAAALQHAHEQNLIHRDIKPDNVLVSSKGVVKVADLGLAKQTDDDLSLTRTGTGMGTAFYMPLEQYRDAKRVDGRADIYALGVMLYYFLSGDLPFKGKTHAEVVEAKTSGKYKPARQLNPDVPERLSLMMDKMIAKEPGHRYQTCAELIKDLDSLGVASEYLSFVGGAPGSTARLTVGTGGSSAKGKSDIGVSGSDDRPERELWVLSYPDATGKRIKKQLSTGRIRQLIECGEIDPGVAQASRYGQKQLRPLTSFREFESLTRAQATTSKSDRMTQKLERAYEKTAKAERDRQLFQKIGNRLRTFASYLFLLALLAVLAIGGFLFWKNSDKVLPKAKELISNPGGGGGQSTPAPGAPATSAPAAQPTQQPPATGAQPAGSQPAQPAGK